MPHKRLLPKQKAHSIGDCIINWIEKWLTDRRLRVVVDGEVSNCFKWGTRRISFRTYIILNIINLTRLPPKAEKLRCQVYKEAIESPTIIHLCNPALLDTDHLHDRCDMWEIGNHYEFSIMRQRNPIYVDRW